MKAFNAPVLLLSMLLCLQAPAAEDAVGYLMDGKGSTLTRGGKELKITSSCFRLRPNDQIRTGKKGGCTLVFPKEIFAMKAGQAVTILGPSQVESIGDSAAATPLLASRDGRGSTVGVDALVMPPAKILTVRKPPVTRDGDEPVTLLSPRGDLLSNKPVFIWTGDKQKTYTVEIRKDGGDGWMRTKATGSRLDWKKTGWIELERDEKYHVRVRLDGKTVNGRDTFYVFPKVDAGIISKDIAMIKKQLGEGSAADFVIATILLDNMCLAEARNIAGELLDAEPGNLIYLRLLQYCYSELGLKKHFEAIQERVETLREK